MAPEERNFGSVMFKALANPARLHILEVLAEGPASVNRIAERVGLKQSMASQHLSALLRAGVVVRRANGNVRIYSLRGQRIAQILMLVDEFYEVHLGSLQELLGRR
jgi:DNA-binding transcriptional ArsR family regulator